MGPIRESHTLANCRVNEHTEIDVVVQYYTPEMQVMDEHGRMGPVYVDKEQTKVRTCTRLQPVIVYVPTDEIGDNMLRIELGVQSIIDLAERLKAIRKIRKTRTYEPEY